jgi:putative NADPH-quinone reductase
MTTIIFSHPWHGSFNKAILDTITSLFDKANKAYQIIDLPKDGFNPAMSEAELAVYNKGKALDPLVTKYQEMVGNSDELIFIFPIWWGTMPAILKGFFDKVLLVDFAYNYEGGWNPLLDIRKTTVITTSESPTADFKLFVEDCFIRQMLHSVGIVNATWLNCEQTPSGTDEMRKAFLKKVETSVL